MLSKPWDVGTMVVEVDDVVEVEVEVVVTVASFVMVDTSYMVVVV